MDDDYIMIDIYENIHDELRAVTKKLGKAQKKVFTMLPYLTRKLFHFGKQMLLTRRVTCKWKIYCCSNGCCGGDGAHDSAGSCACNDDIIGDKSNHNMINICLFLIHTLLNLATNLY